MSNPNSIPVPSPGHADPENTFNLIRRLLAEYGLTQWRRYAFAFALMGVGAACTALTAYLMGSVINEAYEQRNFQNVIWVSTLVLIVFITRGVTIYGQSVILSRIANSIIADNQRRVYSKLLEQNLSYFANFHSSEFITRMTAGTAATAQTLNLLISTLGRDGLTLVALVSVMVAQDPVMSLAALLIAPPAAFMIRKLTRRIRAVARSQWAGGAQTMETLQETIQGMRIVKAFTLESILHERFLTNVANVEQQSNKMARVGQRVNPLMETLGGITITVVIIYAGYRVIYTGATAGGFFSFLTAFLLAYEPAKRIARFNLDLTSSLIGVRMLFDIIDAKSTEPADDDRPALTADKGRIEFSDVTFGYPGGNRVFDRLSFTAEPGKMTALVGHSGGGKSTIFNLILRLYEVDAGEITIDGQNAQIVSRRSLRRQIAYVGQDTFLFRATIRDNIAFGKPGATAQEIESAAKAAHAHDFITGFPAGYDTAVGEQGLNLSGGQRQRIAIARALIKNAPIILLDEATAALDSESEQTVQQAVAELCKGRTTIAIAHRLSTIMHADDIMVIEGGTVAESGRHDELLRRGGRYASFYHLQLRRQQPAATTETSPTETSPPESALTRSAPRESSPHVEQFGLAS
jgi:ATP-binding cassette, subfamily B, bacterial MsbA